RFDLAAAAPEDVGVAHRDADGFQVLVDGALMGEDEVFVGAVRDAHDVDVAELLAGLAPVSMGHDVEAADLSARVQLAALRDGPVEQGVVLGDLLAGFELLDVLEEGGEPADDAATVEVAGDGVEFFERYPAGFRPRLPKIFGDL